MAQARLNRRRYREAVAVLKELISDKRQPAARRLRATEMLLSIYDRHDRNEQRKDAARRVAVSPEYPEPTEEASEPLEAMLARLQAEREQETRK